MAKMNSCMFKVGYFLYTKTRIGYFYHRREITRYAQEHPDGHSKCQATEFMGLMIIPVPMLKDNYAYIIIETRNRTTVVVDPGDAHAVQAALKKADVIPSAVLTTHRHWDHSGGNAHMKRMYPDIKVYGGACDRVPGATNTVTDGDLIQYGPLRFKVMSTPGHTVGHLTYLLEGNQFGAPDSLFSGDHLFLSGCGRMFECSADVMLKSLDSLHYLPDDTLVWPGHEYAVQNLKFAIHLNPDNEITRQKLNWAFKQRKKMLPTCPSSLREEKLYNPFLRLSDKVILQSLNIEWSEEDAEREDDNSGGGGESTTTGTGLGRGGKDGGASNGSASHGGSGGGGGGGGGWDSTADGGGGVANRKFLARVLTEMRERKEIYNQEV
ncbi:hydroxyacylglutathione hydrolase, mitochondrial-like isoform X1 [Argonauta hians]